METINIGLPENVLESIIKVMRYNEKISKAVVYGSRAKGNYRRYSDIDIALFGGLDFIEAHRVYEQLDILPTPYKFDVAAYDCIKNKNLKEHIDRIGVTIYQK
ncbi:MAG: nucleotidyltransferase domain-containing protein [Oscillospiraceae bacterium]|nr:nucleotidyltransferase domain-containing protein [Oscillospiraceae bacterium]